MYYELGSFFVWSLLCAIFARLGDMGKGWHAKLVARQPQDRRAAAIGRGLMAYRLMGSACLTGILAVNQLFARGFITYSTALGVTAGAIAAVFSLWKRAESLAAVSASTNELP
jgi:hypothetical protein